MTQHLELTSVILPQQGSRSTPASEAAHASNTQTLFKWTTSIALQWFEPALRTWTASKLCLHAQTCMQGCLCMFNCYSAAYFHKHSATFFTSTASTTCKAWTDVTWHGCRLLTLPLRLQATPSPIGTCTTCPAGTATRQHASAANNLGGRVSKRPTMPGADSKTCSQVRNETTRSQKTAKPCACV
jgi:hypothetical protein